jgi:C1A family cysteine protease
MNIDYRNRFGRNWITSVRDQGGSSNCWAFATTALYEAMDPH